jgi:hypothetical protein
VGISGDIIHDWFDSRNEPTLFRPYAQAPTAEFGIGLRTSGDPAALAGAARRALLAVDPAQPVFNLRTQRAAISERTVGLKYLASVMAVFAALALLLAAVGLYAVLASGRATRHEIGLRMAWRFRRRRPPTTVGQALQLTLVGTGIASRCRSPSDA